MFNTECSTLGVEHRVLNKIHMKIYLKKKPTNITLLMRHLGYAPDRRQKPGSLSFSRRLGNDDYPKFHIYFNQRQSTIDQSYLNLHLDMKKPSYANSHAHSGEYDSELVLEEAQRIKQLLNS